jgi:hypothetical protein
MEQSYFGRKGHSVYTCRAVAEASETSLGVLGSFSASNTSHQAPTQGESVYCEVIDARDGI